MGAPILWVLLVLVLVGVTRAGASNPQPVPEISILEYHDNGTIASSYNFSGDSRPHFITSTNVSSIALECRANYPVMWTIDSLDQPGIVGSESQRLVTDPIAINFNSPSTYIFSMTIRLQIAELSQSGLEEFVCHAADDADGTLADLVRVNSKWDISLAAFVFSRKTEPPQQHSTKLVYHSYLNGTNPNISLTTSWTDDVGGRPLEQIWCCEKEYMRGRLTDLKNGYCQEPLWCLAQSFPLNKVYHAATGSSPGCRSFSMRRPENHDYNPAIHVCEFEPWHNGTTKTTMAQRAFILEPSGRKFIHLHYQQLRSGSQTWTGQWVNVEQGGEPVPFAMGETMRVQCQAAQFFYATGILWEKEFKNGTRVFMRANLTTGAWGSLAAEMTVVLNTEQLTRITCHVPPWNSTSWESMVVNFVVDSRVGSDSDSKMASNWDWNGLGTVLLVFVIILLAAVVALTFLWVTTARKVSRLGSEYGKSRYTESGVTMSTFTDY